MLLAADGLPARDSGPWTAEKLGYVERYATAFMRAMRPKHAAKKWDRLVYIDLLCGPGLCIDRTTGDEYLGSALRAVQIRPQFDHYFFSDLKGPNIAALRARIPAARRVDTSICAGDC